MKLPLAALALTGLAAERDWAIFHSEDPPTFSDTGLARYEFLVCSSTTGDVFAEPEFLEHLAGVVEWASGRE